jgi:putative ABC transport system ATP-binding protein
MSEAIIETVGLTKIYKMGEHEIRAIDNVNLRVHRGEFLSIVGPSGSGKSTLLHLIGCIDRPTHGKVFIEGKNVNKLKERELDELRLRKIGFVFQTFNLLSTLTALENVELSMELAGKSRKERAKRAKELLSIVGLSERLRHRPRQLSVGEQQRVAIARALANDPLIILADEPTGNVDSRTAMEIVTIFKIISRKYKKIIVLVTHNTEISKEAHRVLQLRDGKLIS